MPEKNEEASREEVATTDEHSFDALAKGVADDTLPRSKALKSVFAAIVGGVFGVFALPSRDAEAARRPLLKTLWLLRDVDGNVVSAKGVTGINDNDTGQFEVIFNRDVSGCAKTVSIYGGFPPGEITTQDQLSNRVIAVLTFNSSGTLSDRGFSLVVHC